MTTRNASSASQMLAAAALVVFALATMPARADVRFNGPVLNGPVLNGPVLNGPVLNGPTLNGPTLNGPILQGPILQGPVFQGPIFQGPALNAVTTAARPGGFVAVSLPGGEMIPLR